MLLKTGESFGSDTDTKIGPWFWFLIPKPGFGRTLASANQDQRILTILLVKNLKNWLID